MTYMQTYMVLWFNSFELPEDQKVESFVTKINLASVPAIVITILLFGCFSDKIKPMYMMAGAFLLRGVFGYSIRFITDPNSFFSYAVIILFVTGATGLIISMESYFMKNLPGEIRGAMTMLLMFFLSSWAMTFNAIAGPLFDEFGPSMPFRLVSILDAVMCIAAIVLGLSGYLNVPTSNE